MAVIWNHTGTTSANSFQILLVQIYAATHRNKRFIFRSFHFRVQDVTKRMESANWIFDRSSSACNEYQSKMYCLLGIRDHDTAFCAVSHIKESI